VGNIFEQTILQQAAVMFCALFMFCAQPDGNFVMYNHDSSLSLFYTPARI